MEKERALRIMEGEIRKKEKDREREKGSKKIKAIIIIDRKEKKL